MTSNSVDPAFAKIESLVKANDMTGAYQELEKLAKSGNPQAIYNLGYLTQTGQGTAKDDKKAFKLYQFVIIVFFIHKICVFNNC